MFTEKEVFFATLIALLLWVIAAFTKADAQLDTTYINGVRQIVSDCTLEIDTTPHVFRITEYTSDMHHKAWLDTTGRWMWIKDGIAINRNGGWQRYLRPKFSVIDMGVGK